MLRKVSFLLGDQSMKSFWIPDSSHSEPLASLTLGQICRLGIVPSLDLLLVTTPDIFETEGLDRGPKSVKRSKDIDEDKPWRKTKAVSEASYTFDILRRGSRNPCSSKGDTDSLMNFYRQNAADNVLNWQLPHFGSNCRKPVCMFSHGGKKDGPNHAVTSTQESLKALIYGTDIYLSPMHASSEVAHKIFSSLRPYKLNIPEASRDRRLGTAIEVAPAIIQGPSAEMSRGVVKRAGDNKRIIVCTGGPNTYNRLLAKPCAEKSSSFQMVNHRSQIHLAQMGDDDRSKT
ncbi:Protein transport protein Sec23A [Datura stramonium]|uniref:Protein transport protein SEC23 n=1 Tax=Datura stramonium TaxID=4076 RepID=A0ABS8S7D8_DATST|nr:Protein transport protein Sec23A [Datura stramonium]